MVLKGLFITVGIIILSASLFYIFYRNGYGVVNRKSALFYMCFPRWGKRKNAIEEKFSSCNGYVKRVIRLSPRKRYQFVFTSSTTKGTVFVEIYGRKNELIAQLSGKQPCTVISTEKCTRFPVVTKFIKADGVCKLAWKEVLLSGHDFQAEVM